MCTCFNLNSNLFLRKKRKKDLVESKLLFASLTWMVMGTSGEKMGLSFKDICEKYVLHNKLCE